MIGIDTNILVRAYLEDDKKQAAEAKNFLSYKLKPFDQAIQKELLMKL